MQLVAEKGDVVSSSMTLSVFCDGGALGPYAQCPVATMGLPRRGTLPGTSNEPPGMRQEAASGRARRLSLFSHQGIPLWGSQPYRRTCS